jgi:pyruvate,orthophosphate dikinase
MITFGPGSSAVAKPEDNAKSTDLVKSENFGNKAAVLAQISALGIPVPPGFSLGVAICEDYYACGGQLPGDTYDLLKAGIAYLERSTGMTFGSDRRPLLVSVRSGAPVSMPGVMDTVLNVGLNRDTLRGLTYMTGNPRFAWDTYRRYLESFGKIVLGYSPSEFQAALKEAMAAAGVKDEAGMDFHSLKELAERYERIFAKDGERKFPESVEEQLRTAATAVIRSWSNPRAEAFRRLNLVGKARGTAVTVQAMVYGNMGLSSGAGVAFTRNPWTGEKTLLVDFKFGAQGEDVVSGEQGAATQADMAAAMPEVHRELHSIATKLEQHFRDMQDIEFTVQEGRLYILQSRNGKRGPLAALRIAADLAEEKLIAPREAIERLRDVPLDSIYVQRLATGEGPIGTGISASSGIVAGRIALTGERAEAYAGNGPVILVRETASPDDLPGIDASAGLLTARGARTSHAAVVARQMGKVCVVNCADLAIEAKKHRCRIGQATLGEGDLITLDGSSGRVYAGQVPVIQERPEELLARVRQWAAETKAEGSTVNPGLRAGRNPA